MDQFSEIMHREPGRAEFDMLLGVVEMLLAHVVKHEYGGSGGAFLLSLSDDERDQLKRVVQYRSGFAGFEPTT